MGNGAAWRPPLTRWSLFAVAWHASVWGGAALLLWALTLLGGANAASLGALTSLVILALVSELRPVVMPGNDPYGVVASDAFVFAILYIYGIGPALLAQAVVTLTSELMRRKTAWKVFFNVGQYSVSMAAAWPIMLLAGVEPSMASPTTMIDGADLPWMVATWVVYFLVNNTLVAGVSADEGQSFREAFFEDIWYYVLTHSAVFVLSPVVALVALGPWQMLPLFLLPLFAVYKAAAISREKDHAASHDALTGLPNRRLMAGRAAEAIALAERDGTGAAILLLDLNRFKEINDTLGHAAGDQVLQIAAQRIRAAVRPGDTVARLGGDEFAVVLPDLTDALPAVEVAGRVRASLRDALHVEDAVLAMDVSIGVALFPEHGADVEDLLRRADVAMYLAKENRSHIEVFRADHDSASTGRLSLLGALRRAIDDRDIVVHYQPIVTVPGFDVVGMEALVRWNHPVRGLLPPSEFLPVAESSGLMHRLTRLVLEDAIGQAAAWRDAGHQIPVAVNVTLRDLAGASLVETCEQLLAHHGLTGESLQLEITERLLMAEPDSVGRQVEALADRGVRFSLDDFGTGFASLVMLRRLPVDRLKIDSSFVRRLSVGDDDRAIVRSIIDLAHALGMSVVAEGVETALVWQRLHELGCDTAQGWHIGRDMPADEANEWLRVHAATRPTVAPSMSPSRDAAGSESAPLRLVQGVGD
jgi:diguanylate cyclase (GGDEF)-like protein